VDEAILKKIGATHVKSGVQNEHFPVYNILIYQFPKLTYLQKENIAH